MRRAMPLWSTNIPSIVRLFGNPTEDGTDSEEIELFTHQLETSKVQSQGHRLGSCFWLAFLLGCAVPWLLYAYITYRKEIIDGFNTSQPLLLSRHRLRDTSRTRLRGLPTTF